MSNLKRHYCSKINASDQYNNNNDDEPEYPSKSHQTKSQCIRDHIREQVVKKKIKQESPPFDQLSDNDQDGDQRNLASFADNSNAEEAEMSENFISNTVTEDASLARNENVCLFNWVLKHKLNSYLKMFSYVE